mmetsp:Transcript_17341/g.38377  ORF Transcript_17341/g.38377 Transcript_17341/m.38377 type:complete len:137 (+) Transcript_17341:2357-2767(+)
MSVYNANTKQLLLPVASRINGSFELADALVISCCPSLSLRVCDQSKQQCKQSNGDLPTMRRNFFCCVRTAAKLCECALVLLTCGNISFGDKEKPRLGEQNWERCIEFITCPAESSGHNCVTLCWPLSANTKAAVFV